jgi:predicted nucleotidyltransferase
MRLHRGLDSVLSTRTSLRVLRALVAVPDRTWTGRELSSVARSSPPQTQEALKQLERLGIVWRATAGKAHLWHLTPEHILVGPLQSLFAFEADLPQSFLDELRSALQRLPLRRATLFGSVARGTETLDSDVDLYLELADPASEDEVQAQLTPIVARFIRRYGVVLSPIVRSSRTRRPYRNPELMQALERDGVPLVGEAA